jgi:hypothetical protein
VRAAKNRKAFENSPGPPDAGRFLEILSGRKTAPPPLIAYLVDAAVMKPIVAGILGRTWSPYGTGRTSYIPVGNYLAMVDEANGTP